MLNKILITGTSSGLGKELAKSYLKKKIYRNWNFPEKSKNDA